MMLVTTILAAWLVIGLSWLKQYLETRSFPPGPPRYPIVGSLPSANFDFSSRGAFEATALKKIYGNIMGYLIGPFR
jgi:hypothetical protein